MSKKTLGSISNSTHVKICETLDPEKAEKQIEIVDEELGDDNDFIPNRF